MNKEEEILKKCKKNLNKYKKNLDVNFIENIPLKNIPYDYIQLRSYDRKELIKIILIFQKEISILNLIKSKGGNK